MTLSNREKLYEYSLNFTHVTDYGVTLDDILSGKVAPPPEGARIDVGFEGKISGRINGSVKGVDYLYVRADGRLQLDIKAEITTDDGARVALAADGTATPAPGSPIVQIRENVRLHTSHPDYAWVNRLAVWAPGTVDLSNGTVFVEGFSA